MVVLALSIGSLLVVTFIAGFLYLRYRQREHQEITAFRQAVRVDSHAGSRPSARLTLVTDDPAQPRGLGRSATRRERRQEQRDPRSEPSRALIAASAEEVVDVEIDSNLFRLSDTSA